MEDREDLQATFDLRWKADMRAVKMWRDAHPGKELTLPDHADNTHFNGLGATVMAEAVAKSIVGSAVPLKRRVVKSLRSK